QGEWLNLVAKAGFSYLMANVKYLRDGQYAVHRIEEDAARDAATLTTVRIRPVMPGKNSSPARVTSATGGKTKSVPAWKLPSQVAGWVPDIRTRPLRGVGRARAERADHRGNQGSERRGDSRGDRDGAQRGHRLHARRRDRWER